MNKNLIFAGIFALMSIVTLTAQVGINTETPQATLDIVASVKSGAINDGILIPRISETDRDNMTSPVNGLLIYNTTENCVNMYNGTKWISLCTSSTPLVTNGLSLTAVNDSVQLGGKLTKNTDINLNSNNLTFSNSGNVGIGTTSPLSILHLKDVVNDPLIIDSLKFTSDPPHSVNDTVYYNLQISGDGVMRRSPIINDLSETYIYTLSPEMLVATGTASGIGGSQFKWAKNKVTFDHITLPEDGAYVFSFRLYGTTSPTNTGYMVNSFYLCAFKGSLSGTPADAQEIIVSTPNSTYNKMTYSSILTLSGKAGTQVYFKIGELSDTHQMNWTLLGTPPGGLETDANRTSMIFWKI